MLYFSYWAKTNYRERKSNPDAAKKRHLAVYHLLDVAACCKVLLEDHPYILDKLSALLNIDSDTLKKWIIFGSSLHDVAKISLEFQAKNPVPDCKALGYPTCPSISCKDLENVSERLHHSHAGIAVWRYHIQKILERKGILTEVHSRTSIDFFAAFASHHGSPHKESYRHVFNSRFKRSPQGIKDLEAIEELTEDLIELLDPQPLSLSKTRRDAIRKASWIINGVVNQADWLGSDAEYFPYIDKPMDLTVYWQEHALPKARKRYGESGLSPVRWKSKGFAEVFPHFNRPLPVQKWADTVQIKKGANLFIIETGTGSGKSEGGLTLSSRIADLMNRAGVYFTLPTRSSAEKMFARVLDDFCGNTFDGVPTVALAHSTASSNKRYKSIKYANTQSQYGDVGQDNKPKGTTTDFLTFSRKAALLTQVGVGTVDQLILSVLPRHHQTLRLSGLLNKVVIIDEIHSYQEYQQVILERFLELAGDFEIPVILLSATLSSFRKKRLISAFQNESVDTIDLDPSYPLYTAVNKEEGIYAQNSPQDLEKDLPKDLASKLSREVHVENVGMGTARRGRCFQALIARAQKGGCACWMKNTVKNAIKTYNQLKKLAPPGVSVMLSHSRYSVKHRGNNDRLAEKYFGSKSTWDQRAGKIVVATQVYEQSLDLDFDFMISDLAPIAILIQRIGRLCRHFRERIKGEGDLRQPMAWIYGPYFKETPDDENWLGPLSKVAPFIVYGNVFNMWKTQRAIEQGVWKFPTNARSLMEDVYSSDELCPAGLLEKMETYKSLLYSEDCDARTARLDFEAGWYEAGSENWTDNEIYTRLMEPTTTFYLCSRKGDRIQPFDCDNWNDSKITVPVRTASKPQQDLTPLAKKQGLDWMVRKKAKFLEVHEDGGHVYVFDGQGDPKTKKYTRELGFTGQGM